MIGEHGKTENSWIFMVVPPYKTPVGFDVLIAANGRFPLVAEGFHKYENIPVKRGDNSQSMRASA